MYPRPHRAQLKIACLLLIAACRSAAPSEMSPSGVNMQGPAQPGAHAGNSTSAGGVGAGPNGTGGRTNATGGTGATPATVGASGTGPSGAAGSGTSTAGDIGNYFVSGAWHGYAWTAVQAAGSTITPTDFAMQTTGMPRCVKGSVAATMDYSGIANVGFNLNQANGSSTTMAVTPTKGGVVLDVKNTAGSPLRFQVEGSSGGTVTRWCAVVKGAGGFIPWTSLNTMCWDGSGKAYNKEPITAAMLVVPGTTMAAVPFDFCVNSVAEADAPVGGTAGDGAAGTGNAGTGAAGMNMGTAGSTSVGPTKYPRLSGGCDGYATRYWDCCKPHCGWSANVPGGVNPVAACDQSGKSLGGNYDAANSCTGGPAYLCHSMAPWAADDQLAFGYAAVAATGDICGKCYQLDFGGRSHNSGDDPGAAALNGKTMIVQAINIGGDVGSGQFDISIPGGGVGAYNACSVQWGVSPGELGAQYGGLLASCKQQSNASDHAALKSCVMRSCKSVFEDHGLTDLAAGCRWYVDWFQVADNPAVKYAEVACPSELTGKGVRRQGAPGNACLL